MENYRGDLTDIVRASGGQMGCNSNSASASDNPSSNWQFPSSDPLNFASSIHDDCREYFSSDPFSNMGDPLFHGLNMNTGSSYYNPSNNTEIIPTSVDETAANSFCGGSNSYILAHQRVPEDDLKSPCNIFSRIQISSSWQSPKLHPISLCDSPVMAVTASPRGIKAPVLVASDMINANSSKSCLVDNTGLVQISSPRNMGIKRRKSQVKKVVCIPAPAVGNSRSSGEAVPSDLWAWRKYGQKPIKGSPYPRGYYRCSSSKGCSARKQVERSRTDPNMLVITYTSEHNHPWPTQRNALAGSTRSQPSKNNAASKISPSSQPQNTMEEVKESSNDTMSPTIVAPSLSASIKEEIEDIEKSIEMDDAEFNEEFSQIYKPTLPDSNQSEDFFADLGEIEADPLSLLFSQGFSGDEQKERKGLDPFSLFDWPEDNSNNINKTASLGETKRGL